MAKQFSVKDGKPWKARFFTIWGGQALSILGSQLVQFALIWHLTVKTGSATVLATASMVGMLPSVILGPFVGTLVDRWNRRWIMLIADSIITLATAVLAVLFALDAVAIWHIYVVMFIRSLAGCFHGNAMSASTSLMVPVENLTRLQGINQMLNGGLNVVSAPLGALLLDVMPLQGILAIDVVTALLAILPLFFIQIPQPERIERGKMQSEAQATVWQDFKAGFRYLLGWPGLLIIGLMTVGINFTIIPAFSLLPLMVKDYFGGDAIQLSWVESAMGIGIIVGGALLGVWGGFKRKILTSMIGLMGMGAGTLILALAPSSAMTLAVGGALLVGLMNPLTMGPFFAVIQSTVEPDMQARIFSLLSSVGGGMAPIGLMIAGPVADRVGIQAWFLVGGLLCILMAVAGLFIPAVMNIEEKRSIVFDKLSTGSEQAA
ncbi:MAG: MFS transporter [Anaerolineaceae bacterium]|nr:MFS transporter [Anaerolineaceae bacterium]